MVLCAQKIGAWIITDGLNNGITREIGEAIRNNSFYSKDSYFFQNLKTEESRDNFKNTEYTEEIKLIGITKSIDNNFLHV